MTIKLPRALVLPAVGGLILLTAAPAGAAQTPAALTAAVTASAAAGAVAADVPAQQAAIAKLGFMVGRWAGSGWVIGSSGTRQEFLQTENVQTKVSGTVISVDGEGRDKADPARVVDTALAVLTYDDSIGQYRWEAFSQGYITEAVPVVGPNTFQWSLVYPGTTIRYTLTFTATTWHEIGEVTTDGGSTWHQNFQMDLRRIGRPQAG